MVQPTTVIINIFVVIDINTGDPFDRPAGTEGTEDITHAVTVWQLDVTMAMVDADEHRFTVNWTGVVTLNPDDGSLSGEGTGQWDVAGPYYEGSTPIGQMTANGFFSVELSGQLDPSDSGDVLTIFPAPANFSIDSQNWNPPDDSGVAVASFEDAIESLIVSSFNKNLAFPPTQDGPISIDVAKDDWTGSATLAPYEP